MTNREIYLKAAEIVIKQKTFACCAINIAENSNITKTSNNRKTFKKWFEPLSIEIYGNVWWENNIGRGSKKNQLARSLALLFMAEMSEK